MRKHQSVPSLKGAKLSKETLVEQYHSRIAFEKTWGDRLADSFTRRFGTIQFLFVTVFVIALWIPWNLGVFGLPIFDPYPFILLTAVLSIAAMVLTTVVLISQNRQGKIADIRQKLDFEIDVRAEEEVTRILEMLEEIQHHLGIKKRKDEVTAQWMKEKVDLEALKRTAEE